MRQYRYSLGLLELASGAAFLLSALCTSLVSQLGVYPPLGFLPIFVATPLLFWVSTKTQECMPETSRLATFSLSKNRVLLAAGVLLLLPVLQISLFSSLRGADSFPLTIGFVITGALILFGDAKPQVWLLAGLSLVLGLVLTLYTRPDYAALVYCGVVGVLLIPVGIVTLRRELLR